MKFHNYAMAHRLIYHFWFATMWRCIPDSVGKLAFDWELNPDLSLSGGMCYHYTTKCSQTMTGIQRLYLMTTLYFYLAVVHYQVVVILTYIRISPSNRGTG